MRVSVLPVLLACALAVAIPVEAQQSILIVRHAERADDAAGGQTMMAKDPDLSAAGHARAKSLAAMLKDSRITAVYATEYKRTQQTAAPLAKALGITVTVVPSKDTPGLIQKLQKTKGPALVVGHSNSVPDIIKGLGVNAPITIADDEYDNLFVVTTGNQPQVLRLRYR